MKADVGGGCGGMGGICNSVDNFWKGLILNLPALYIKKSFFNSPLLEDFRQ